MTQFLGTHQNKLDAKGRVSVPAAFRAVLRQNDDADGAHHEPPTGAANGNGCAIPLVLRPSHKYPCIEGWPPAAFKALAKPIDDYALFSHEHDDLASTLFALASRVEADKEGRIILPDSLIAHAGLSESVVFLGIGRIFQIWEPRAAQQRLAEATERVRTRNLTLHAPSLG